jgi:hypothetical protein
LPSLVIDDLSKRVCLLLTQQNVHYGYSGLYSIETLTEFVEDAITNAIEVNFSDLQPNYVSQPLPETNDGPLKIVVLDNWDQIVRESNTDVFLWYTSQCKTFGHHQTVVIASDSSQSWMNS